MVDWSRDVVSLVRDVVDAVEEMLVCLFDTLGLLNIGPTRDRAACACESCCWPCWIGARADAPARYVLGRSTILLFPKPCASKMLPSPVGDGNCVNSRSLEADSMLVWKSSKLTSGRKA